MAEVDVNLQATYTQPTDIIYDKSALPNSQSFAKDGVITGVMTYQPKWKAQPDSHIARISNGACLPNVGM